MLLAQSLFSNPSIGDLLGLPLLVIGIAAWSVIAVGDVDNRSPAVACYEGTIRTKPESDDGLLGT